jgi:hypothetical protein
MIDKTSMYDSNNVPHEVKDNIIITTQGHGCANWNGIEIDIPYELLIEGRNNFFTGRQ